MHVFIDGVNGLVSKCTHGVYHSQHHKRHVRGLHSVSGDMAYLPLVSASRSEPTVGPGLGLKNKSSRHRSRNGIKPLDHLNSLQSNKHESVTNFANNVIERSARNTISALE